ncbi:MAG TPA: hypothetical protein VD995_02620 [Azospirillum sp.]|nr:hypothetical protein [Azospirillum sp.]
MATTLRPEYYAVTRALLAPILTRVHFGTSGEAEAAVITDPIERAVLQAEMRPDGRTLRLHFLLEPGGAPIGTQIREIGLLSVDGRMVARRVGPPLEITDDLGIGDYFDIQV